VVVGGGAGGLAVSARIASSHGSDSRDVVLLEKNGGTGGRAGSRAVGGGHRHERGPSLLLLREEYAALFSECRPGRSMEDYGLETVRCDPAYQVVFGDGDAVSLGHARPLGGGISAAEAESRKKMDAYEGCAPGSGGGAERWDAYMGACGAFLDLGLPAFIENRFDGECARAFLPFVAAALGPGAVSGTGVAASWPLRPHGDALAEAFSGNKMRALASFQDLYVGLSPHGNKDKIAGGVLRKTAPAVFGLLAALELHPTNRRSGVHAPIGGFKAVADAFRRLAEDVGVDVRCGHTVTKVTETGVHYVTDSGERHFLPSDLTIVNTDLPYASKSLLGEDIDADAADPEERYDWDDRYDFSSGVLAFHWSLDVVAEALETHNVFLIADDEESMVRSWGVLQDDDSGGGVEPFNFYVHRPAASDPTAAPEGGDSLMILVPCRTLRRDGDLAGVARAEAIGKYGDQHPAEEVDRTREAVLRRLAALGGLGDLRRHIVREDVTAPADYADAYNLGAGAAFGLSHGLGQLSLTRPGARHGGMKNVMFVGASSRPGNGVPLVLIGAKNVAKEAVRVLEEKGL